MVRDVNPGPGFSSPGELADVGGVLAFEADDGTHGREPWLSDGTAAGTRLAADINPGPASSDPKALVTAGGRVFLVARDDARGYELWALNGPP